MSKIINGEYAADEIYEDDICEIVGWEIYKKVKSAVEMTKDEEGMVTPDNLMYNVLTKYFKVEKDAYEIMEMFKRIYSIY